MKKFLFIILTICLALCALFVVGCKINTSTTPDELKEPEHQLSTFTGITFKDKTVTYNGNPHNLELVGVPTFATANYDKETSYTNAGTYLVKATITAENYVPLELFATLTIEKYELAIVFSGETELVYTGEKQKTITAQGTNIINDTNIPITISYSGNMIDEGVYTVTASINHQNYKLTTNNTTTVTITRDVHTVTFKQEGQADKTILVPHLANGNSQIPDTIPEKGYDINWVDCDLSCVKTDLTIYSQKKLSSYTITYHLNESTNSEENPLTFTLENLEIVLQDPTPPDDAQFFGWYTDIDWNNKIDKIIDVGNIDVYAKIIEGTEGVVYTLSNDTYAVTDYTGASTDVRIANNYKGLTVTIIGEWAFYNCSDLTGIKFPEKLTEIDDYAFSGCTSLQSIEIPTSVTSIGSSAFSGCTAFTNITIPDSVTSVGTYAFSHCSSLQNITVSLNNITYQSIDGDLYSKDGKTLVQYAIGKATTAFTIPNNVTTIGSNAFASCKNLTSVIIGNNVTSIGWSAFSNCINLTNVTMGDEVVSISPCAFYFCSSLTSIKIPDKVTEIGEETFRSCTSLTSVRIGKGVTTIGTAAFYWCTSLTSIDIPYNVITINPYAFYHCSNLKSATIGLYVNFIGIYAFSQCSRLTSVTFDDTTRTWYRSLCSGSGGMNVISLGSTSTNANYLRSVYDDYYWKKH